MQCSFFNKVVRVDSLQKIKEDVIECHACPRLRGWCKEVSIIKRKAYRDQEYWGKPVPGFGDPLARLLIIGLAPGAHGSNRTGRMFTGDASGNFLYPALNKAGFANQTESLNINDGLTLSDTYITAVCRCAPPGNHPTSEEITNCLPFLAREYKQLPVRGIVALGKIAYDASIRLINQITGINYKPPKFEHGVFFAATHNIPWLLASYHPSRQNTQTGKLTREMFQQVWETARQLLM